MDARLRTTIVTVAAVGAIATVGVIAAFGLRAGFSVGSGAAIGAANLFALAKLIVRVMPADEKSGPTPVGSWIVLGMLKMFLLFGVIGILMFLHLVDPIPLFGGIACLPIGIAIGSLVSDRRRPHD